MQIPPVMPFKMVTTMTSWTRMEVRKDSKNSANYVGTESAESTELKM